jgi:hypothetical protein
MSDAYRTQIWLGHGTICLICVHELKKLKFKVRYLQDMARYFGNKVGTRLRSNKILTKNEVQNVFLKYFGFKFKKQRI